MNNLIYAGSEPMTISNDQKVFILALSANQTKLYLFVNSYFFPSYAFKLGHCEIICSASSYTCQPMYNDLLMESKIVGVVDRRSLLRGIYNISGLITSQNSCRCGKVVAIRRWLMSQL
jgi:hypothetical protein